MTKKPRKKTARKDGKKPKYNQNSAIRSALRRSFSRSPIVREVLQEGRREVPKYKKDGSLAAKPAVQYCCQVCDRWVGSSYVSVDHIDPVISSEGTFVDWNTFVDRLWCDKSNLQRICDECHQKKTNEERSARKLVAIKQELEKQLDDHSNKLIENMSREELAKWLNSILVSSVSKSTTL